MSETAPAWSSTVYGWMLPRVRLEKRLWPPRIGAAAKEVAAGVEPAADYPALRRRPDRGHERLDILLLPSVKPRVIFMGDTGTTARSMIDARGGALSRSIWHNNLWDGRAIDGCPYD